MSIGGGIKALNAVLASLWWHTLCLLRRLFTVSGLLYDTHQGSFLLDRKLWGLRGYLRRQLLVDIKIVVFLFEVFQALNLRR